MLRAMQFFRSLRRDSSISAIVAGLVVVLVSYASSLVIVLEAARVAQLSPEQTASWVWAISIGSGLGGLLLTLFTRTPIIAAWSTPGAALLIASIGGFSFDEAVGAFIVASLAATIFGVTGWFGWIMSRVPEPVLQALLAGVLLPFVIAAVGSFETRPILAGGIVLTFFVGKRFFDRYAVPAALAVGIAIAVITNSFGALSVDLSPTVPVFTMPSFTLPAVMSIALPLFVVTMASQNAPGLAILKFEGYEPNARLLVGGISAVGTVLAPFGSHAVNLAAITAAIATGPESHADRSRRYIAGISTGLGYLIVGSLSAQVTSVFAAIPLEGVTTLAAVALLGTTLAALRGSVTTDVRTGFAAVVTLAVTMSGVAFFGVGSAFWGLLAGSVLAFVLRERATRATVSQPEDA